MLQKHTVTQKDLAAAAGLSPAAVSQALIDNPNSTIKVRPETRERVLKLAREMGYHHNRIARLLRTGKSGTIGIVHVWGYSQVSVQRLRGTMAAVTQGGKIPFVLSASTLNPESLERTAISLRESRVEGVIFSLPSIQANPWPRSLVEDLTIPAVCIGSPFLRTMPCHAVDKAAGFRELTEHLIEQGCRNLVRLAMSVDWQCSKKGPGAGFVDAIRACGNKRVKGTVVCYSQFIDGSELVGGNVPSPFYTSGYVLGRELIRRKIRADGFVCQSDGSAAGLIRAFAEEGIGVPGDVAVTGFDNDPYSSVNAVPITTMAHPIDKMSADAVRDLLLAVDQGKQLKPKVKVYPGELIVRQSSVRTPLPRPEFVAADKPIIIDVTAC